MNCLIYSRVSSQEQAEKGRSIDDQVKICEKFAKDNNDHISGVFKDAGKSGTSMNRPALQDLLIRCREDKSINAILVQDTDRISRSTSDHLQIKAILKKHGVQLISTSQPMMSGDSPESQFVDLVISGINQFQSQITARKTSKVMEQKALEGWKPGPPRIGFKNETVDGKNIIVQDKERAPYIKKIFEMYATGTVSLDQIRVELNSKGFRTKSGLPISKSLVASILHDQFYTGALPYKGNILRGKHSPIVSEELFDRCQQLMAQRNHFATRDRKHKYLLRGFLFCGQCGSRIFAEKHVKATGAEFDYYFCQKCSKSYNAIRKIEKQVETAFKKIKFSESLINKIMIRAKSILDETHDGVDFERKILQSRQSKLETRRNALETGYLDGVFNKESFKRQRDKIDEEIFQLEQAISKLKKDRSENIIIFERLLSLSKNIYKDYFKADVQSKKFYLTIFWEQFEIRNGVIEKATPTKLFQTLLNQKSIQPNSKVRIKLDWLPELDSNQ